MKKVSVIIPVYNVEAFLPKCIESVIQQTYSNIEIILVDDGSRDSSLSICENYAAKYDNIIVLKQDNSGVSRARNHGIDVSTGEYIAFVDSDDYIREDMIDKMVSRCEETESDLVICNYTKVSEKEDKIRENDYVRDEVASAREALSWLNRPHGWSYVVVWNRLYKKELFDNLRFDEGKIHEDEIIAHKLFLKCQCIAGMSDNLYFYRKTKDSITSKKANIEKIAGFEGIELRYWDYKRLGFDELLRGTIERAKPFISHIHEYTPKTDEDKKRIADMKSGFRKMVKDLGREAGITNKIISLSPELYYGVRRLVKRG